MNRTTRRAFGGATLAAILAVSAGFAEQSPPVRVRGTVESNDGSVLTVKTREGPSVKVKMTDNVAVRGIVKAALADIKDNAFIGVTSVPQADGSQKAVEIHIFPEAMRGTGEGFRPWDLTPSSTMTNGTVAQMVTNVDGQTIYAQVQGRRAEDRGRAVNLDRDIRSRQQGRAQARRQDLHCRRRHAGGRFAAGCSHLGRPRRDHAADVRLKTRTTVTRTMEVQLPGTSKGGRRSGRVGAGAPRSAWSSRNLKTS